MCREGKGGGWVGRGERESHTQIDTGGTVLVFSIPTAATTEIQVIPSRGVDACHGGGDPGVWRGCEGGCGGREVHVAPGDVAILASGGEVSPIDGRADRE